MLKEQTLLGSRAIYPTYGHGLWTPPLAPGRPGQIFWSIESLLILNELTHFLEGILYVGAVK
jgi:hypothetical protein